MPDKSGRSTWACKPKGDVMSPSLSKANMPRSPEVRKTMPARALYL